MSGNTSTFPPSPAIVLAAGRGERMRPLTDTTPKPLLAVRGKPLMQYHLEALATAGFEAAVVNTAWLGDQIEASFGAALNVQPPPLLRDALLESKQRADAVPTRLALRYSHEGRDFGGALETAGGIARALPMLDEVFWAVAGDVFAPDLVWSRPTRERFARGDALAHLWLVPNPAHHPHGDFAIETPDAQGVGRCVDPPSESPLPRYTFSGFALYRRALFQAPWCDIEYGNPKGTRAALAPLLRRAMREARVSAELYTGRWTDVGTPERLAEINALTP